MSKHADNSQIALVLKHMQRGEEINPLVALTEYGAFRLGAIIHKLKQEGYSIATRLEYCDKPSGRRGHYAVYRLEESV
jgi:hypothetical protein